MTSLSLAFVTRNFWPMSDSGQLAVADIAAELLSRGNNVSAVTVKWEKEWSAYFHYREFPVSRIVKPSFGPWGSYRFSKALAKWILNQKAIDGIYVWGLGDDVAIVRRVLTGLKRKTPIIARVDQSMVGVGIPSSTMQKSVSQLSQADLVLVDSQPTLDRLRKIGLPETPVHIVPDPAPISQTGIEHRTLANQGAARMSLADAHPILAINGNAPLAIAGAPMNGDGGLFDLILAWPIVMETFPKAKAWLLGDGVQSKQIWEAIEHHDLVYSVIMPGYFDDLDEVFLAGDLFVHPSRSPRNCNTLVRAMAQSLCPVVTDTAFTKPLISKNENGIVSPAGNPKALAQAIIHTLKNRELRTRLGNKAAEITNSDFGLKKVADQFLKALNFSKPPSSDAIMASTNEASAHERPSE